MSFNFHILCVRSSESNLYFSKILSGADQGLVVGRGANPFEGAPTQYIYTFSEKPHEFKEILVRRGGRAPGAPP